MKSALILFFFCSAGVLFGQSPGTPGYTNDGHWIFDAARSDEFNGSIFDLSKWTRKDNFDHYCNNWVALDENAILSSDGFDEYLELQFKSESYSCPPNYWNLWNCACQENNGGDPYDNTTGYVISKFQIEYGYLEARIKLPKISGMNAAFWLISGPGVPYGEIDIFEALYENVLWSENFNIPGYPNGIDGYNVTTPQNEFITTSNIHPDQGVNAAFLGNYFFLMEVDDYTEWHTYGLEFTSQKIIWFIDGVKVREEINPQINSALNVVLNIGGHVTEVLPSGTSKNMLIDYFRYYPLKQDCRTISAPTYDFSTYNNHVKDWIQIGSASSYNQTSSNSIVNLRARDFIEINGEFYVPLGSEFTLYPNDCE